MFIVVYVYIKKPNKNHIIYNIVLYPKYII